MNAVQIDAIAHARACGVVRCSVVTGESDLARLIRRFGLIGDAQKLMSVDRNEAVRTVTALLSRNLAYKTVLMPSERAESLARELVAACSTNESRYLTNAPWHLSETISRGAAFTWEPFTEASFDGGVLIVNVTAASCFWVEDED